jgi:hypothetical protein
VRHFHGAVFSSDCTSGPGEPTICVAEFNRPARFAHRGCLIALSDWQVQEYWCRRFPWRPTIVVHFDGSFSTDSGWRTLR